MRTSLTLFILPLMLVVFSGCEKAERLENKLEGTWELRELKGTNLAPNTPTNYASGNGNIYKFSGNNFECHIGGKITDNGTFSVLKEESNSNEVLEFQLVLDGSKYDRSIPFKIADKKLILHFGALASDGAIGTYTRL